MRNIEAINIQFCERLMDVLTIIMKETERMTKENLNPQSDHSWTGHINNTDNMKAFSCDDQHQAYLTIITF